MSRTQIIYGTDYTKPGLEKVFSFSGQRVAGITPGKKSCVAKKQDGNEDSLTWDPDHECGELLIVADSHYGSLASKLCAMRLPKLLEAGPDPLVRRLLRTHFLLDDEVRHARRRDPDQVNCATTLISAVISGSEVHYASTGDSRLWLIRDGRLQDMLGNEAVNLFVGDTTVHLFQLLDQLKDLRILDELTERKGVIETMVRLHEFQSLVKQSLASTEDAEQLIQDLSVLTGLRCPFRAEELIQPWHELHLACERLLPQTGSFKVRPGDLVMLASDGIDEEPSDCSTDKVAELLSETKRSLTQRAERLLSACMGRLGGGDNIAFLIASI